MDGFEPVYSGERRETREAGPAQVTVVNFNMPFWNMVGFMVKWAIAAIPAAIILVIFYLFMAVFGVAFLRGLMQ